MSQAVLLHNMSMRPRTHIAWRIEPACTIACFDLARVAEAVGALVHTPCTDLQAAIRALTMVSRWVRERLTRDLEDAWATIDFRGAALVFPCRATSHRAGKADHQTKKPRLYARDPLLVLNVLGRASSQLLLPSSPLSLEGHHLQRCLGTTDPRLVALAADTTGVS